MASTNPAVEGASEARIGRSVSLDHAAEVLGVSRRTIYNRIREGRLQTIRTLGGSSAFCSSRSPTPAIQAATSLNLQLIEPETFPWTKSR